MGSTHAAVATVGCDAAFGRPLGFAFGDIASTWPNPRKAVKTKKQATQIRARQSRRASPSNIDTGCWLLMLTLLGYMPAYLEANLATKRKCAEIRAVAWKSKEDANGHAHIV